MSVLNKMLRDLEQRRSEPAASAAAIPVSKGRSNVLLVILLLSGLLLLVAYFARLTVKPMDSVALPFNATLAQSSETVVADEAVISGPVNVAHSEQTATVEDMPETLDVTKASAAVEKQQITTPDVIAVIRQADPAPAVTAGIEQVSEKASPGRLEVARSQPTTEEQVDALTQQAVVAAQSGQLAQALRLWQQVQQLQPGVANAYLAQARLWLQLGQPMQAELIVRQGLQHGIVSAELQFLIAQQAASRADWSQVDILLPAQFELAQHPEYYGLKATALQQQGQQQAALHWYQQLLQIQPQQARWWLGAALAYDSLLQYDAAQLHYRQALQWGENLSSASQQFIQQRLAAIE